MSLEYNDIKDLINIINESDFTEFELCIDSTCIKIKKSMPATISEEKPKAVLTEPITILPEDEKPQIEGCIVQSPIVGTFYKSASPDKPAFVKPGDKVKKGDVLCIVEAMKIMNEITSNFDGVIAEVLVENELLVEYGQPLFRIV